MEALVFIRDLIVAVMLSWIGAGETTDTKQEEKHKAPKAKLVSGPCQGAAEQVLILKSNEIELTEDAYFVQLRS